MISVYTYRSNEKPNIQVSFELDSKEKNEEMRDALALDFLKSLINRDNTEDLFYLDDVQEFIK